MPMNKIEKLIKELCPNGVEWKKLNSVVNTITPPKKLKTNEFHNIGEYVIIDQGQDFITGYTDDEDAILPIGDYVLYGDHTCIVKYVNVRFAQGADGLKILKPIKQNCKYIYYAISAYNLKSSEYKRHWTQAKEIEIPLPPLPIQTEIVHILDKFVEQQEQLEKLIELRKKQYEYYREEMLKPKEGEKWETKTIGELGTITRGRRFVRDDVRESGMPCIHYGDMYTYYGITARTTKTFLDRNFPKKMQYAKKGDVVVVGAGENDLDIGVGTVWEGNEPAAVHDACYILTHNQNSKYIAYFLRTNNYHQQLRKYVSDGKICSISGKGLGSCIISIPSLTKQQEIVEFLDKFEFSITALTSALESSKRRYEYYRDKMMRF